MRSAFCGVWSKSALFANVRNVPVQGLQITLCQHHFDVTVTRIVRLLITVTWILFIYCLMIITWITTLRKFWHFKLRWSCHCDARVLLIEGYLKMKLPFSLPTLRDNRPTRAVSTLITSSECAYSFWLTNSEDPYQKPQNAGSDLGLPSVLRFVCLNTWGKYSKAKRSVLYDSNHM